MEEKEKNRECEAQAAAGEEKTTAKPTEEITVPVKFNKEIKNLSLSEAAALAQKGMKLDAVSEDLVRLKNLAELNKQSIKEYLLTLETIANAGKANAAAAAASTGAQSINQSTDRDPASSEFLKGLWGR